MPRHAVKEDRKWIQEQIKQLPTHLQNKAKKAYSDAFIAAYYKEGIEHKRDNAARKEANSRLRQYVFNVVNK